MKIAIKTIVSDNFGNRLQNYAADRLLTDLGCEVETITNEGNLLTESTIKSRIKAAVLFIYERISILNINRLNRGTRIIKFAKFTQNHIKQSRYKINNNTISEDICKEYDYFICGSDQIWNPEFSFNSELDFLTFAPKEKRISYAASFGLSKLPQGCIDNYREWINGMSGLSVRENAGAEIIKELTGRDAVVLLDPTMMLSKDQWLKIAEKPRLNTSKKYILTYFLGDKDKETEQKINDIAQKNNLNVINLLDKDNKYSYIIDPGEFIWLINNCELMYTDSFHGVVFSLILKSPFIVCARKNNDASMNSRIETLMTKFNIRNRLNENVTDEEIFNVDFNGVDEVIEIEKEKTVNYLKNALNIK